MRHVTIFFVIFLIGNTIISCSIRENIKKIFSNNDQNLTHAKEEATGFLEEIINKVLSKKNLTINKITEHTHAIKEKLTEELRYIKLLITIIATTSTIGAITGAYLCVSSLYIQIRKKRKTKQNRYNRKDEAIEMK